MKVGFVGLGAMGRGMAANLLQAGHDVHVWNRSPGPLEDLRQQGAQVADTPAQAAASGIVLSMLADDAAMQDVVFEGGLLDGMPDDGVHVSHATLSLSMARRLTEAHRRRDLHFVAAPVFGRPDMAAAGTLNIITAGSDEAIERIRPLLEAMSGQVWPVGSEPVRANVVKIGGNLMLAQAIESMAEASALVRGHDIAAADFLEIMTRTLFAAPAYQGYGKLIAAGQFEPAGFPIRLGYKDVGLALAAGSEAQVPLPSGSVVHDALLEAMAAGDGELDWAALARIAARRASLGSD